MKTGPLETMATLVDLRKPHPSGSVHFDPARDKLIEMYSVAVDHLDVVHDVRFVCDA